MNATSALKQRLGITWKSGIHRRVANFPERLVVCRTPKGWNACELCGREHRVWIVDDETWRKLPRWMWMMRLCVTCYRIGAQ